MNASKKNLRVCAIFELCERIFSAPKCAGGPADGKFNMENTIKFYNFLFFAISM